MRGSRARASAAALLISACGGETTWLSSPFSADDRSVVLAVERRSAFELFAADAKADVPVLDLDLELRQSEIASVSALLYTEPLASLSLQAGGIDLTSEGRQLPEPREVLVAEVERGRNASWTASSFAPRLRDLRVASLPAACVERRAEAIALPATGSVRFVVALDDGSALAASEHGPAFRFSPAGIVSPIRIDPPGAKLQGGFRDASGRIWAGGEGGRLWAVSDDGDTMRLSLVATATPAGDLLWLAGASSPELEIFAIERRGAVFRFDARGAERIHQYVDGGKGGVAYLGPREALIGTASSPELVHYAGGQVRLGALTSDAFSVTGLASVEGFGAVAATVDGRLFHARAGADFELLAQTDLRLDIYALHASAGGVVFGGAFGWFGELRGDGVACPSFQVSTGSVRSIVQLGEALLLNGDGRPRDGAIIATLLYPR